MACTNDLTSQTTISSSRRRTGVCALLVGIGSTAGVVALAISLVLVASAAAAQARPARTALFTTCSPLAGLRWSVGGKSGNRYIVETQRFSCARALKLIPGLMKQQGGKNGGKTLRGPVGYKCLSGRLLRPLLRLGAQGQLSQAHRRLARVACQPPGQRWNDPGLLHESRWHPARDRHRQGRALPQL